MTIARHAVCVAALLAAACADNPPRGAAPPPPDAAARPGGGPVHVDRAEFQRFIATRPTAADFKARYPQILLVEPGMVTTRELRTDNSRFFPALDAQGRITGGRFQ